MTVVAALPHALFTAISSFASIVPGNRDYRWV